ncbi:hypothetical protein, partial [Pseudovibrio sp. W64]|uniref:hypothetical protein n=1 Tax=Pseudovibrio sp. W64 TaxID=1735583 RepID=UPI0019D40B34
ENGPQPQTPVCDSVPTQQQLACQSAKAEEMNTPVQPHTIEITREINFRTRTKLPCGAALQI